MSEKHLQANGDITSFHRGGLALIFILAILAIGLVGPREAATNDSPVISGNTATYSGNQQPNAIIQNGTSIYTINVQNLTTNVGSSSMGTSISLSNTGSNASDHGHSGGNAQNLLLGYSGGTYYLYGLNFGAYLNTSGGTGYKGGGSGSGQDAGNGGAGGSGGTATITTSGAVQTSGTGIAALSYGGAAGDGGDASGAFLNQYGGDGGSGGNAGTVTVTTNGAIQAAGVGILAVSTGGKAGDGGTAGTAGKGTGGDGGKGGSSGGVSVTANASITSTGDNHEALAAISQGGAGGTGGRGGGDKGIGGDGGAGGAGGTVTVNTYTGTITTSGASSYGILAQSLGGAAGGAGEGNGTGGNQGGVGGIGGAGGTVTVTNNDTINTSGSNSFGIYAISVGGAGGAGGSSSGGSGEGGNGSAGGAGGGVTVTGNGAITTTGANAHGIYAQSSGGTGGSGGQSKAGGGSGGGGASGGNGGTVSVTGNGTYHVQGSNAYGLVAQSSGGTGGSGASAQTGTSANGGAGGAGGAGGGVTVTNTTSGNITSSAGYDILAQSIGGAGGGGGFGGGTSGVGGNGGVGGTGGSVGVTNNGTLTSSGANAYAILAQSVGGAGGGGATGGGVKGAGGNGGAGGAGGGVTVTNNGTITTTNTGAHGIYAQSAGGGGGSGGQGNGAGGNGGNAGAGGSAGSATVTSSGTISTGAAIGINGESLGGAGQNGGAGYGVSGIGGSGNNGGVSGKVTVNAKANITTDGQHYAIRAVSAGGKGGDGGNAGGVNGMGGNAGAGGNSATGDGTSIVAVTVDPGITLKGGILAASNAGAGGKGHTSVGVGAEGGNGGAGGTGGAVQVTNNGSITVTGITGIQAQSIAGVGGAGGDAKAAGDSAGHGGAGGTGGTVNVTGSGNISVTGNGVYGILAQSQGGAGGSGGNAYGGVAIPGDAGASGIAGAVTVSTTGGISTSGTDSCGILAQSLGGVGGGGGDGYALVGWGGAVSGGANGSSVTVNTGSAGNSSASFTTLGSGAIAIFAQSVGGGGGNGGSSGGIVTLGSSGAGGGNGGIVSVTNYLALTTAGNSAHGIEAQSVGGGGGNGGGAVSLAPGFGVSIGGSGGSGGSGGQVGAANSGRISTSGGSSYGILAQSLGGGGGDGDYAINAGGGVVQFSMGGSGGSGGSGGNVTVTNAGAISTSGGSSYGILAQSLGGGGGSGAFNITEGASLEQFGIGGSGGSGGSGGKVSVASGNTISTSGGSAVGILAQSLGGGGGSGSGALTAGTAVILCGMGGTGGSGGSGGEVNVGGSTAYSSSNITTAGSNAQGILAQSVGGGGGNGGFDVTAGIGITVGIGGSGGTGGNGGVVNVYNSGTMTTGNDSSQGILAQSLGGGGGNGGWSFSANITPILSASFSLGGSGNTAGYGSAVTVSNTGSIATGSITTNSDGTQTVLGSKAHGIFAQSVGGGGGNAGWSGTGTLSFSVPDVPVSASMSISLGGSGGSGGDGGNVTVNNLAPTGGGSTISTMGDSAYGIFAQSVGGGGGSGGGSAAVALNFSVPESLGITTPISVGGAGGTGGIGHQVSVTNQNAITTLGQGSLGILAQSVGGGGGDAGWSVSTIVGAGATDSCTLQATTSVGGSGGSGGAGGIVQVTNTGAISTSGQSAIGIEAQSVGGGGGNGGSSTSVDALLGKTNSMNFGITMGGQGGLGGDGANVTVTSGQAGNPVIGAITTLGESAHGILAQSIGGGGGNGGEASSYAFRGGLGDNTTCSITANITVGGAGGPGGNEGNVMVAVTNYANISTAGDKAYGIEAQSVGGGGGNGGASSAINVSTSVTKDEEKTMVLPSANITGTASVGGGGGDGKHGGAVAVANAGNITTQGMLSYGIFAQSVGGGGGVGGESYNFDMVAALSKAGNANNKEPAGLNLKETVSVGGNGGGASDGGVVTVTNSGAIKTSGSSAYGIFAQSVGGGGGAGGAAVSGVEIPAEEYNSWKSWVIPSGDFTVKVGGSGGSCGNGKQVTVNNIGSITTSGDGAHGIYAQSLGGGGGVASYDQSKMFTDADNNGGDIDKGMTFEILMGGTGGAAGNGGAVQVTNSGAINTSGEQAYGIFAQSIGGGGGSASVHGGPWHGINFMQYFGMAVNIGRSGGSGGSGGDVTVTNTANITTQGNNANGIFAQSVGGAGGSGSQTTQYLQGFLWNGSFLSGAGGTGGNVTVSQTGTISTSGQDAHGIVAQSIAGKDQAGNVVVTLNDPASTAATGNIIASGLGSSGIVAQSLGAGGNNTVNITINQPNANSGLVQGGQSGTATNPDGSTTTYNAYGVLIMDGKQNTLTNHGSISTLDGATGTAVMVQASYGSPAWGDLTINNYGVLTGSVNQGTQAASSMNTGLSLPSGKSNIIVNNISGATLNAGPVLNLGGGTLANSGLFSLDLVHSALTGDYTQTGTGTFKVMLNGDGSSGQLNVSGTANLGGTLQVGTKTTNPFKDGTRFTLLTGNLTNGFANFLLPTTTPLLSFGLEYTGSGLKSSGLTAAAGNAVQIVSHANSYTSVTSSSTHTVIGSYLDQLLATDSTGRFASILAEIQRLDHPLFRDAFESLTPSIYGANTDSTFAITRQYTRTLQQRMEALRSVQWAETAPQALSERSFPRSASRDSDLGQRKDSFQQSADRLGFWMEGFGQWGNEGSRDSVSGYNYGMGGAAFGLDYAFARNLILGANFGSSWTDLNMDNGVGDGKINSLYGSLYGTYFTERAYVESVFSYGNHHYDNSRRINIGSLQSATESSHTGNAFSVLTEAGYKFPVRQWNLQPFASIGYCNLDEGRIEESGDLAAMRIRSRSTDSVASEIGIEVNRPLNTSKGTLVPMVRASWQHDFGVSDNNLPVSFADVPVSTTVPLPKVSQDTAVVRAGLTFKAVGGITSSIQYMGELGEKTQNHGIIGEFRISF